MYGLTTSSAENAMVFPSGDQAGLKPKSVSTALGFSRRADDEDAAVRVGFVEGDELAVGRERRPALVAVRIRRDGERLPAADALNEDVVRGRHV